MPPHDFVESLKKSQAQAGNPLWERVYQRAFPTLQTMADVRQDGWAQRGGIDRVLILSSGKTIHVDEKVRDKDYGDILLEYWSDEAGRVPGWIAKDLACDFIAYAVLPSSKCYLLPFHTLRLAWQLNRRHWVEKFKRIEAQNRGYVTVSVGVPADILLSALSEAAEVSWL